MSVHSKKSMSASIAGGSEEDFENICDPCSSDGQRKEAVSFCTNCQENLCVTCVKCHKNMSVSRNHVIRDISAKPITQTPKTPVKVSADTKDPLTERCPRHPEEVIKFYCNTHQALGCGVCIPLDHRNCKGVSYVRDISGGIEDCSEFKQVRADLRQFLATLNFNKSRAEYNAGNRKESYSQTVSEIRQFRQEINAFLDQLENDMLKKASELSEKDVNTSNATKADCEDMIADIEDAISDLEEKIKLGHRNMLFIAMKQARERIPAIQNETEKISNNIKAKRYIFRPDDKLTDMMSKSTSFGDVQLVARNPADTKARFLYDINVKTAADSKDCNITDAVVLHDGRLAVIDNHNKSVKLIDITQRKVTSHVTLPFEPLCLTEVSDDQLAITEEKKISVINVSQNLSVSHHITVSDKNNKSVGYNGITYSSDRFILAGTKSVKAVHIVDMSGHILKQFDSDCDGNTLFEWTSRLALSPDHSVMYVSDSERHTVTCMDMDGEVIWVYKHGELKDPRGIAVDTDGSVYVCSGHAHSVHQLTPTGKLIQILLKKADGLLYPCAIAHSDSDRKLYISSARTDPNFSKNIKVFQLK